MKVNNITELIGRTPLVKINKINEGNAEIYAKLEYFNPSGSVKDRAAFYMLKCAIDEGKVNEDTVIIEPTSGNTGIGLAMCAAQAGLKILLTMPESMSEERKKIQEIQNQRSSAATYFKNMNGVAQAGYGVYDLKR